MMRLTIPYPNLILLLTMALPLIKAQAVDNVWFPSSNFTYCYQAQFNVTNVTRYFDASSSSYHLYFSAVSNTTVTNLNTQGSTSSASMFDLKFGFQTFQAPNQQFCLDSVKGCPIVSGQPFVIQRSFNLTSHSLYPLVDITARYSAIDADSNHLVCIHLAPVGYQDPMWRKIFIFLPVGLTVSAAIISLIGSFIRFEDSEHDIFLFSSNYAMLPGILRLKTPAFFDLVFYAQFVVISGLFNIDYPRFQSLFTSNFSWSFLLFKSAWLQDVFQHIFTSYSSPVQEIGSIEGTSIYKRQLSNETDSNSFDISGTSMLNFATASGIDINALFLTFLVHLAILIAACATCCFVTWAFLLIVGKLSPESKFSKQSTKVLDFSIGVLVRILSLIYLPMITLSFYQLMLTSHAYITCFAALCVVFPLLFYGFACIKLLEIRPASFLFTELKLLLRYGSLYNVYKDDTFHLFVGTIVSKSLIAAMIGLFQASAVAQIILVLLAELAMTVSFLVKWPCADYQVNLYHVFYGCLRCIVLLLNICYLPALKMTTSSKAYIGYCQVAIHALAFLCFLILLIRNAVVILTGIEDDELNNADTPPARMVIWRKRHASKRRPVATPLQLGNSSGNLMSASSRSRSYSASFYMTGYHNSQTRASTLDNQTMDLLTNYYGVGNNPSSSNNTTSVSTLKPDEIRRTSTPLLATNERTRSWPSTVPLSDQPDRLVIDQYTAQTNVPFPEQDIAPMTRTTYRIDDDIIPVTEPLMATIEHAVQERQIGLSPRPPPLPKHAVNIKQTNKSSSIYSPPHQSSSIQIDTDEE